MDKVGQGRYQLGAIDTQEKEWKSGAGVAGAEELVWELEPINQGEGDQRSGVDHHRLGGSRSPATPGKAITRLTSARIWARGTL